MSKYIDTDLLRAEIEKRKKQHQQDYESGDTTEFHRIVEDDAIVGIIDSLQQEQPELEEEIEKGWEKLEKDYSPSALDKSYIIVSGLVGEKQFSRIARHFYELGLNAKEENK